MSNMEVYRITVVEDQFYDKELILSYLRCYEDSNNCKFKVDYYEDGQTLINNYDKNVDIMLMDIDLPALNGMDAAKMIRGKDKDVVIVFLTNLAKYAINGYEVGALDFVLKPISYFAFSKKIEKAITYVKKSLPSYIIVKNEDGIHRISVKDIYFIEVNDHWLNIYTVSGTLKCLGSLKSMEEELCNKAFGRCNRCYLVNLQHIKSVNNEIVTLSNDIQLKISRPKRKEFKTKILKYLGGYRSE